MIERLKYPPSQSDGGRMGRELVPVEVESEIERWRGTADADDLDSALVEVYALPHAGAPGRRFDGATWSWVAP